jgi:2-polyprenyl-3-methyl-5-hydroxy-6-metoxy-1,4-benzoquinol methylase
MTASPHSRSRRPGGPDDLYRSPPPWDIGRPQGVFRALADAGAIRGRVLDAGCGTGEHVLMCAGLGLDATGVDLASEALRSAQEKAREWRVDSIEPATIEITSDPDGVRAWFAALTRS